MTHLPNISYYINVGSLMKDKYLEVKQPRFNSLLLTTRNNSYKWVEKHILDLNFNETSGPTSKPENKRSGQRTAVHHQDGFIIKIMQLHDISNRAVARNSLLLTILGSRVSSTKPSLTCKTEHTSNCPTSNKSAKFGEL